MDVISPSSWVDMKYVWTQLIPSPMIIFISLFTWNKSKIIQNRLHIFFNNSV